MITIDRIPNEDAELRRKYIFQVTWTASSGREFHTRGKSPMNALFEQGNFIKYVHPEYLAEYEAYITGK